ncbi:PP2C family protein-serine/threonine phosphatase [Azospirillum rugosum]|uniref:Serine phosphatase RsbU (Regulator of sigma subunit) n=1 Tax=Azospirillum rugosum TaxID=416170 RepID=A0ABS4SCL0_9PROT|nr:SpoIIE family protein phosphatase [Azospirillum rugosum]MBP2290298.1 serine phosphatase RsbU (regulator of sigma subunit) [Azospirillum rugosum]MDQ0527774.1 serine phosphatase RsbU (regulator of sigma subunit) [Azospirillum rugosum]
MSVLVMNGLRQRMTVVAVGAVLAMLATAAGFSLLRTEVVSSRHAEEEARLVQRLWEGLLDQTAAAAKAAVGDPRLTTALERGDAAAATERLRALELTSVALLNGAGQTLLGAPAGDAARLIDERRIGQVLTQNYVHDGLVLSGGTAQLLLAQPFGAQRPADRVVVAVRPLTDSLETLADVHGGSAYLTDADGKLYGHAGPLAWNDVRPALRMDGGEPVRATIAERAYDIRSLRLPKVAGAGPEGGATLFLVTARETTLVAMADSLLDTTTILVVLTVLAAGTLGLDWFFRRSFNPVYASMSALSALAAGDTSVAVLGAERHDEAGRLARTVEVFRDRSRALRDAEERRARHWLRQQAFIRKQMLRLAETLPEQGQRELLADLARIEAAAAERPGGDRADDPGALAVAFEVMAERVRDQHAELDGMVRQLQAALNTRTELLELQKQFEIARRMQAAMLPADLPDLPDLEAAGLMRPAAEFDGSFYDFFQTADGTLVVLLGQVSGGGLAAGFMTVTARAAVRTLAEAGQGPAACLTGANRLLAADNAAGRAIGLAMGVVAPRSRRLVFAAAGMPEPFILRRFGDVVDLPVAANPPLGLDAGMAVTETALELPVPSTLVLCNGGLLDGANRFGVGFGRARMTDTLGNLDDLSAHSVTAAVSAALAEHAGGAPMPQDRLCVALRVRA